VTTGSHVRSLPENVRKKESQKPRPDLCEALLLLHLAHCESELPVSEIYETQRPRTKQICAGQADREPEESQPAHHRLWYCLRERQWGAVHATQDG
jgi:hypothetical protein